MRIIFFYFGLFLMFSCQDSFPAREEENIAPETKRSTVLLFTLQPEYEYQRHQCRQPGKNRPGIDLRSRRQYQSLQQLPHEHIHPQQPTLSRIRLLSLRPDLDHDRDGNYPRQA